ncbi:hypothetical protein GO495_14680 [Chitinophaga oryziterrae]|uniref:Uncharacterized protein n=1 Tax=Chitinophaga oryziterrae TaxID=1031224 RepID=A0A6N8J9N8_9BACT|nr:hypothetical protein [Chitinophaga oryziterrae]MVT41833.1 hypothetical protein [Chitinophaga oryziterrae]
MPVNYIKQQQLFFDRVRKDSSITSQHQVLYIHLFLQWNKQHFNPHIKLNREEIMAASGIGSTDTYYTCLKYLSTAGYLIYPDRKKGCVKMLESYKEAVNTDTGTKDNPDTGTSKSQDSGQSGNLKENEVPDSGQPFINNKTVVNNVNRTNTNYTPSPEEVRIFFELRKFTPDEAIIFREHFEKKDWKTNGKPIQNWKGMAITFVTALRNNKKDNDNNGSTTDFDTP